MKLYPTLISFLIFFTGCAAEERTYLPELTLNQSVQEKNGCEGVFPMGEWQFVHSIDFTTPDGTGTTVVGITTLSADSIKSALITVEGFTLLEADLLQDNTIHVHRAVPPFDNPGFAEGMMRDIRTIFQAPTGSMFQKGRIAGGDVICRYTDANNRVTDILPNKDDCWQINSYTPAQIKERSITGRSCTMIESALIPEDLVLQTYGMNGYTLKMTLLRAEIF